MPEVIYMKEITTGSRRKYMTKYVFTILKVSPTSSIKMLKSSLIGMPIEMCLRRTIGRNEPANPITPTRDIITAISLNSNNGFLSLSNTVSCFIGFFES
jgi:hypothetical protein